jgi:hypothetical protein
VELYLREVEVLYGIGDAQTRERLHEGVAVSGGCNGSFIHAYCPEIVFAVNNGFSSHKRTAVEPSKLIRNSDLTCMYLHPDLAPLFGTISILEICPVEHLSESSPYLGLTQR